MTELEVSKPKRAKAKSNANGLVVPDLSGGRAGWLAQEGTSPRPGKSLSGTAYSESLATSR